MRYRKAIVAAFGGPALLFACAIDIGPFFTTPATPENQAAFNGGQIGLLDPVMTKENELIAFRLLSGLKMESGYGGKESAVATHQPTGMQAWLERRRMVKDLPVPGYINTYRAATLDRRVYYENCLSDAFDTAARTLDDRQKSYGSAPAVKDWVVAQDQVFQDCSSIKPVYPDSLPAAASTLEKADREYQIAAAHFYAEDLAGAADRLRNIANDAKTPWQHIGSYLVARALLREASLQNNAAALTEAREQLTKISNDSSAGPLADSARRMLEHLDAVERPQQTLKTLSERLLAPQKLGASIEDAVNQSAFVLRATSFQTALSSPEVPEVFDWVQTLEKGNGEHALQRWRDGKSLPWLTLSMMYGSGKDAAAPELIAQAESVTESSPAFGTVSYNRIRLHIERGEVNQARTQLDRVLNLKVDVPGSLMNGWRAERMRVATSFDDFLRWAPRRPIDPQFYIGNRAGIDSSILAYDSAYVLNYLTPLAKLNQAAHSNLLPRSSRFEVAMAAWTRAFMLNDLDTARSAALVMSKTHPDWQAGLVPASAAQTDQWKFKAALFIALHHEVEPVVAVGYAGPESLGSWWCPVEVPQPNPRQGNDEFTSIAWRLPVAFTPSKNVLSQQDLDRAGREISELHGKGSTEVFLAPIIFGWAKAHPNDPLVPQALHRLVVVTRYGCRSDDPRIGEVSKAAFDLLHRRYPKSPWTAKTPYWFN